MTDALNGITAYITALLANRPALAILIGLTFSLGLTQWLKFVLLRTHWLPDPSVWIIKAIAMPVGALATFLALPPTMEWIVRLLVGVATGALAPYAYRLITAVLYRFWPDLEARLSVDPYAEKPGGV